MSASLAFVKGIQRWLADSPYKWPVTRKAFPFDDDFMTINIGVLEWENNSSYGELQFP